jgi:hypothetical protein
MVGALLTFGVIAGVAGIAVSAIVWALVPTRRIPTWPAAASTA